MMLGLSAHLDAAGGHQCAARLLAGGAFFSLLVALGAGLLRARKQVQADEADAALEADFRLLERELAPRGPDEVRAGRKGA